MPPPFKLLPRKLWDALAAKYSYPLPVYPVTDIYIHHTAGFAPTDLRDRDGDGAPDAEESIVRGVQRHHMTTRGWSDIAYNFLVGKSGWIYRGRGWRNQGGATGNGKDRHSLSICLIGNYENTKPTSVQLVAIVQWIITGIEKGHIVPDVRIHGHRDAYATACPGRNVMTHLPRIRSEVRDGRVAAEETMDTPISEWYTHLRDVPDGTKDEAVRAWQYMLWLQDELDIVEIDGVAGPKTRAAHERFERSQGNSNPNGKPGATSWANLMQGPDPVIEQVKVTEVVEVPVTPDLSVLDVAVEEVFVAAEAVRDEVDRLNG